MNPFERVARMAKANALIRAIDVSGLRPTSQDVRGWAEPTWKILAQIADVPMPSVRTREMVANQLAEREQLLACKSVLGTPRKGHGNVVPLGAVEVRT